MRLKGNRKFQPRYIGPFEIEKKLSSVNYRLKLPETLRIHPTFHVSLLKKVAAGLRVMLPPKPIQTKEGEEFEVKQIFDSKVKKGLLY